MKVHFPVHHHALVYSMVYVMYSSFASLVRFARFVRKRMPQRALQVELDREIDVPAGTDSFCTSIDELCLGLSYSLSDECR